MGLLTFYSSRGSGFVGRRGKMPVTRSAASIQPNIHNTMEAAHHKGDMGSPSAFRSRPIDAMLNDEPSTRNRSVPQSYRSWIRETTEERSLILLTRL